MAGLPLREYIREIEKQVDSGHTDEAIAHCRYILEYYPKYVDAYRQLGKAFLESQRYGDAADIFQRVLSSQPDDFVSHVGMSIVREDEGNLDEAIWHMERAFEIQPANGAIQEELRRLYGRRDNVEPPKIRLTRGALARMYARGELYPQAIAEIRAILIDNPHRLDLEVLLADIYAQANQRGEAVEGASQVLRKLPYCLVANRIMVNLLTGTDRAEEAKTFQQRIVELDPYAGLVSSTTPAPESVPDAAIRLDKLDWKPSQAATSKAGQPTWAATLGVDLGEYTPGQAESLPDWLSISATESSQEPTDVDASVFSIEPESARLATLSSEDTAIPTGEEEIPDWMKSAGWQPSTGAGEATESSYRFEEQLGNEVVEGELAAAELPDWLQAIAPSDVVQEEQISGQAEEDVSPWLDKLFSGEAQADQADHQPRQEFAQPEWEETSVAADQTMPEADLFAEIPDWLKDDQSSPGEAQPAEELPDWLKAGGAVAAAAAAGEIPDWLQGGEETPAEAQPAEELPAWLSREAEQAAPAAEVPEAQPAEELPGWLLEETEQPAPAAEELPDWLKTGGAVAAAAAAEEIPDWLQGGEETPAEAQPSEELPAWLLGEAEQATPAAEVPEAQPAEELPAWLLEETEQPAPAAEELPDWLKTGGAVAAAAAAEEIPDWLQGGEETPAEAQPAEELPAWLLGEAEQAAAAAEVPEAQPAEELPAWLLGEAEQAAAAAEVPEAQPAEELPAWLSEEAEQVVPAAKTPEAQPAEELPSWLLEEAEQAAPAAEIPEAQPAEELPDWLKTVGAVAATATAAEVPDWLHTGEETPAKAVPAEELPAWLLEETEQPTPPAEITEAEPAEELPAWLLEETEQPTPPAEITEAEPAEELPAWLLEETEQPALAAEITEAQPAEELPTWLSGEAEQAAPAAKTPEAQPAEEIGEEKIEMEDAFAWLQSMMTLGEPESAGETQIETVIPEAELPQTIAEEVVTQMATPPSPETTIPPKAIPAAPSGIVTDEDAAFAWLEALAVKQGAQEALLLKPEERIEKPPEWVEQATRQAEQEQIPVEPEIADQAAAAGPPPVEVEPPVLAAEPAAEVPAPAPAQPAAIPLDEDAAFAWLEALAVKQGAQEALLLKPEERVEKPPEWIEQATRQAEQERAMASSIEPETAATEAAIAAAAAIEALESEEEAPEPEAEEQTAAQTVPSEELARPALTAKATPSTPLDDESAFAWLESLAVRQGAQEALLLKPEERQETPPEWVLEQEKQIAEPPETQAPPAEPIAAPAGLAEIIAAEPQADLELPEWLQEKEAPPAAKAPEAAQAIPEMPAWLVEEEESTSTEAMQPEPLAAEPAPASAQADSSTGVTAGKTKPKSGTTSRRRQTGGLPPLPDWLATPISETSEELEWTPPPVPKRKYDLNKASLGELERLPGIGFIMAQRIVDYRYQYGPFKYVEDLLNVPEFSPATLEGIRDNLVIEASPALPSAPRPVPATATVLLIHEEGEPVDLSSAREMLGQGYLDEALQRYAQLAHSPDLLPKVIADLQDASAIYPQEVNIWQQLGDAYLFSNQMNEALKAYTNAEKLLR